MEAVAGLSADARDVEEGNVEPELIAGDAEAKNQPLFKSFHPRTGLTDCSFSKRKMVCFCCKNEIQKGSFKLEHHYSTQKPPRSIHPECASTISKESMPKSLEWLVSERDKHEGDVLAYLDRAIDLLRAAQSA